MILDADQRAALAAVNHGRNVFVTGPAGTGKSAVMVKLVRSRSTPGTRTASTHVAATTGVAAMSLRDKLRAEGCNVTCGTIYRWSGIGIGPRQGESFADAFDRIASGGGFHWMAARQRIANTSLLVVDEVSMLPGRVLAFVDFACRRVRQDPRPMGGIQVVAVGDFLQLPPVAKDGRYDWAFASDAWAGLNFVPITLRTIHRQNDPDFVRVLGEVRNGALTRAGADILKRRVALFPPEELLRLLTHNTQVDKWNRRMLEGIEEPMRTYRAETGGAYHQVENLRKNLGCPEVLALKRGARVMVTKNLTGSGQDLLAANGDLGVVLDMTSDHIELRLDGGRDISLQRYQFRDDGGDGWFCQFPLRLSWATTVHKAQGLTLDNALVDVRAAREPGQAYVALSRVRTLAGLHLKEWLGGLFVSPQARDFHARLHSPPSNQPTNQPLTLRSTP